MLSKTTKTIAVSIAGLIIVYFAMRFVVLPWIDSAVYDNRTHNIPCEQLPDPAEARTVFAEHVSVIEKIKKTDPGQVDVYVDDIRCSGRGDIVIDYPTRETRMKIETIIEGQAGITETHFFGVPYRMMNY